MENTFELVHVGINTNSPEEAAQLAELLCGLFNLAPKHGNKSEFAGPYFECMKEPFLGTNGHIAMRTADLTAAVEANTAALLAANSKLAQMVRKADTLVLSDNMAVSRTVAASGTAQIAAAANSYHREGDTTVNQYIYSKAQTAADLARETRWEADRAKGHKR